MFFRKPPVDAESKIDLQPETQVWALDNFGDFFKPRVISGHPGTVAGVNDDGLIRVQWNNGYHSDDVAPYQITAAGGPIFKH